jgi:hypothetical protein
VERSNASSRELHIVTMERCHKTKNYNEGQNITNEKEVEVILFIEHFDKLQIASHAGSIIDRCNSPKRPPDTTKCESVERGVIQK